MPDRFPADYPCPSCGVIVPEQPFVYIQHGIGWDRRVDHCPACHNTVHGPTILHAFRVH